MIRMDAPLTGVKVVEAGTFMSVPFAGHMLSELGATVHKIEPPDGDAFRKFAHRHNGLSAAWVNVNRSKTSLWLDLKKPSDREKALACISEADVFIQNWRPGVAEDLGFDYEHLVAGHPELVYVAVTGFGPKARDLNVPVFDTLIQALSGLSTLESRSPKPIALRSFVADKTTAMYVVQGVLAALWKRAMTGSGSRLELAMLDTMAHFNFPDLFQQRTFLDDSATPIPPAPVPAVFRTSDGYICVVPAFGHHLSAVLKSFGLGEHVSGLREIPKFHEMMERFVETVETATVSRTTDDCVATLSNAGVPVARVVNPDEHLSLPLVSQNELYDLEETTVGSIRRVRHPLLVDGQPLAQPPTQPMNRPSGDES